jgi:hypothetical protein
LTFLPFEISLLGILLILSVQVVISLLKIALDTAGADGMSALNGPYERKDLPVAEKQSWTPVPPYIPRIQLQQLCNVAPLPTTVDAAPWWKLPIWNRKSSSSHASLSISSASLSSSSTAARPESVLAALAEELLNPKPVSSLLAASSMLEAPLATSNHILSETVSAAAQSNRPVLKPPPFTQGLWKRPRHEEDKEIDVQQRVASNRGSILLAQSLALKQAHNMLSWQVLFSSTQPPDVFLSLRPVAFLSYESRSLTPFCQLVDCCSLPPWLSGAK